jgi:hypothetical protein
MSLNCFFCSTQRHVAGELPKKRVNRVRGFPVCTAQGKNYHKMLFTQKIIRSNKKIHESKAHKSYRRCCAFSTEEKRKLGCEKFHTREWCSVCRAAPGGIKLSCAKPPKCVRRTKSHVYGNPIFNTS